MAQALPEGMPQVLPAQVGELLVKKCGECHSKNLRAPKGGFGFIENLAKVRTEYFQPKDPQDSDLWIWLFDPEDPMPPKKAKQGPLSAKELALMRWWLAAGAPLPQAKGDSTIEAIPPATNESNFVAAMHPVFVHFPIALILLAACAEILRILKGEAFRLVVRLALGIGALAAVCATLSGLQAADHEGYLEATVETHERLGLATTILAVLAWICLEWALKKNGHKRLELIFRLALFSAALLVAWGGHEGGLLVFGPDHFA